MRRIAGCDQFVEFIGRFASQLALLDFSQCDFIARCLRREAILLGSLQGEVAAFHVPQLAIALSTHQLGGWILGVDPSGAGQPSLSVADGPYIQIVGSPVSTPLAGDVASQDQHRHQGHDPGRPDQAAPSEPALWRCCWNLFPGLGPASSCSRHYTAFAIMTRPREGTSSGFHTGSRTQRWTMLFFTVLFLTVVR